MLRGPFKPLLRSHDLKGGRECVGGQGVGVPDGHRCPAHHRPAGARVEDVPDAEDGLGELTRSGAAVLEYDGERPRAEAEALAAAWRPLLKGDRP